MTIIYSNHLDSKPDFFSVVHKTLIITISISSTIHPTFRNILIVNTVADMPKGNFVLKRNRTREKLITTEIHPSPLVDISFLYFLSVFHFPASVLYRFSAFPFYTTSYLSLFYKPIFVSRRQNIRMFY